ncbi:hypothetical protein D9757_003470 [Collybiopsis confluens]|uniref:Uncharacterized protein n=1 Tax=Collybiopsis confluens TaxID=2823264 RepID=A0A8H5HTV1_9AGAR|nr:hypothetical protein D9757_003470 [Collybiopsis confluens]
MASFSIWELARFGHTARYLPRNQVSSYLAVEPNGLMHFGLRDAAHKAGYLESDGSFFLLPCGAEDTQTIIRTTHSSGGSVDCIVCILTLCSIPDAEKILMRLVRDVLRPGGTLFIFEHVRNRREDVAWWQWLWSPIWSVFFDGCRLDRATDKWVERMEDIDSSGGMMAMWKSVIMKYSTENDLEDNIMPHVLGTFIKHD